MKCHIKPQSHPTRTALAKNKQYHFSPVKKRKEKKANKFF